MWALPSSVITYCVAVLLLLLAVPAPVAAKKRTVTFFQDPPTMDTESISGNIMIYQYFATLRTMKGGPIVGTLHGQTSYNEELDAAAVRLNERMNESGWT